MQSVRRSARVRDKPPVSYYQEEPDIEDLASDSGEGADEEEDEHDSDVSFSIDHGTKKRKGKVSVAMMQKKRKVAKPSIFRWADLPGEIRNRIYDYAHVRHDDPIRISATNLSKTLTHGKRRAEHEGPKLAWSLLFLNKQTYSEAAPILYSANKFEFYCWRSLYMFLFPLGSETKSWIRSVEILLHFTRVHEWSFVALDALISATNLQRLDIHSIRNERHFYICAHRWLEAVGKQKGDKYAALDILRSKRRYEGDNYDPDKLKALMR